MKKLFTLIALSVNVVYTSSGQKKDSINVTVKWGAESQELKDYHRFEEIDYFNVNIEGEKLKNKHYIIIAKEYWNKNLAKTDTVVNTKRMNLKIDNDKFNFTLLSKKTDIDSVKMMFLFPNFGNVRKFATTKVNTYSLRDPSDSKPVKYNINQPFTLFAYSLPYIDPKQPGFLFYCELSKNGTPAEKWGEVFNIDHYITFDMVIL